MKEKPIIFSTEMIRAILNGNKTQTRRVAKNIFYSHHVGNEKYFVIKQDKKYRKYDFFRFTGIIESELIKMICPYQIGQVLWVRETFTPLTKGYAYKADNSINKKYAKWKPSIFMPRDAARIFLKVINIRVKRIQDITRSDIRAEGLQPPKELWSDELEYNYKNWLHDEWVKLWDSINKKRGFGWDVNPWAWVIEFVRIKQ